MVTEIEIEPRACFHCGEISPVRRVRLQPTPATTFDRRPPGAVGQDVQRCPVCGYCAPGLAGPEGLEPDELAAFLRGSMYCDQADNPHLPELANIQLCWALVCRQARQFEPAGWAALSAAWLCDDEGRAEAARWCRERALEMFLQAPSTPELQMLQVDLLRRCGRFEGARTHCQKLLKTKLTAAQSRILKQQLALIARQEAGAGLPAPGPRKRW